eukprot:GILK01001416.1.p1 GENE.GILK01001416.1~~GILK01001416.1.p1  ORF type:complete len:367 (-),score=53.67 GILK01001416.1:166-1224(-)
MDVSQLLFQDSVPSRDFPITRKVTVIGAGSVGVACAYSILLQGHCQQLTLLDVFAEKTKGEVLDLQDCMCQMNKRIVITGGTDYALSDDSHIVVVTAGARQRPGESRLELTQRNVDLMKIIIPKVVKHSPNCILVMVTNPCDIITWTAWKLSGLPAHRVFGSGTLLDSSRFRVKVAEKLEVDPRSVHGYVLGEHGDSSVAVWSHVTVGGVRLDKLIASSADPTATMSEWNELHTAVRDAAKNIIALKGYTAWAIGAVVSQIVDCIFHDNRTVLPISTKVKGLHGVDTDVFLSVPCVLGRGGVVSRVHTDFSADELNKFQKSANLLWDICSSVDVTPLPESGTADIAIPINKN